MQHKGETLKVGDKIMKKNKKAEQRKGDKLGPRWLGPYLITDVHKNGNYMVANPKMGKVLATRCLQSECKLYIDLVLGTTEKEYQDALDEAKKLEPQYLEHLAPLESSEDITSSQSSEDFITSSQSSDDLKSLDGLMASHALGDNEDKDDQEEEVQEEEEEVHEQQEENNIKVINIKEAGPVQFIPLDAKQRQATCELVNLKN